MMPDSDSDDDEEKIQNKQKRREYRGRRKTTRRSRASPRAESDDDSDSGEDAEQGKSSAKPEERGGGERRRLDLPRLNLGARKRDDHEEKADDSDNDSDSDSDNEGDAATQSTALLDLEKNTLPGMKKMPNGLMKADSPSDIPPFQNLKRFTIAWNVFCFSWIILTTQVLCLWSEMCSEDVDPTVPDVRDAVISIAVISIVLIIPLGIIATEWESKFLLWVHVVFTSMGVIAIFGLMIQVLLLSRPKDSRNYVESNWNASAIIDEYAKMKYNNSMDAMSDERSRKGLILGLYGAFLMFLFASICLALSIALIVKITMNNGGTVSCSDPSDLFECGMKSKRLSILPDLSDSPVFRVVGRIGIPYFHGERTRLFQISIFFSLIGIIFLLCAMCAFSDEQGTLEDVYWVRVKIEGIQNEEPGAGTSSVKLYLGLANFAATVNGRDVGTFDYDDSECGNYGTNLNSTAAWINACEHCDETIMGTQSAIAIAFITSFSSVGLQISRIYRDNNCNKVLGMVTGLVSATSSAAALGEFNSYCTENFESAPGVSTRVGPVYILAGIATAIKGMVFFLHLLTPSVTAASENEE